MRPTDQQRETSEFYKASAWITSRWYAELGYLPADAYLERRGLWLALTELAPLEHPELVVNSPMCTTAVEQVWQYHDLASLNERIWGKFGVTRNWQYTNPVTLPQRRILATIRDEWDALPCREESRRGLREDLARRYGVPVEAITEPMYPHRGCAPYRVRATALEAYAAAGLRVGAEIEDSLHKQYPRLYWMAHPPVELPDIRRLCAWVEEAGKKARVDRFPSEESETWTRLICSEAGRRRASAYGIVSLESRRRRKVGLHPGWRERLNEMERVAAALGVG
jgi:hypothetical protein